MEEKIKKKQEKLMKEEKNKGEKRRKRKCIKEKRTRYENLQPFALFASIESSRAETRCFLNTFIATVTSIVV